MPDEMSHLILANHNQSLIAHLAPRISDYSDWIATIAFYKALHVVEAVFAGDPLINHANDHEHRDRCLKTTPKYTKLYKHYRPLKAASMAARYMQDNVTKFSDRFPAGCVVSVLLNHHLHQLESSAVNFMKTPSSLDRISSLQLKP